MSILPNKKFLSLTEKQKHKHAAILLKEIFESNKDLSFYQPYEELLSLSPLQWDEKHLLDRIHLHETLALIPFSLQYKVSKKDQESSIPPLEIDIYLENLRSMHNIGAILRTVEAFRLGTVFVSKSLPPSALKKIQKTAMGAEQVIQIHTIDDCLHLKRPLIAVETIPAGEDCNTFIFPKSFTLLFGNEQYGLSDETLEKADHFIQIPLYGNKNSLNVATAFAILSNCIRKMVAEKSIVT